MSDKRVSAYGKNVSEVAPMSFINDALKDAQFWAEELQNAEFKGLGDTREAARFRVARKTGVPESYLKRLRYRCHEMTDVAGSTYRLLMLAYEAMCQRNKEAADRYRAERLSLREPDEVDHKPAHTSMGKGTALD